MSLAESVHAAMGRLSPGERRVARGLLADYPGAGLGTSSQLATACGVSAPTVIRFARTLGYAGYPALQAALRQELSERAASPISRYEQEAGADGRGVAGGHSVADGLGITVDAVASSIAAIPRDELERALTLLADPRRTVTAMGGRYSGLIASYLLLHLQQTRPGVRARDEALSLGSGDVIDAGRNDVFVLYDFRRYQRSTIERARRLAEVGASIICITDEWLSPVARVADVVLPTSVRSSGPFDSAAAAFVLTELLINELVVRLGDDALQRMRRWESASAYEVEPTG